MFRTGVPRHAASNRAAYDVLKSGGVFGITEHRARPFADAFESSKALHRLPEDYLIALGLKTGFRLDGVSEIHANPKDPEAVNVHRLPPDLAGPTDEQVARWLNPERLHFRAATSPSAPDTARPECIQSVCTKALRRKPGKNRTIS